MGILFANSEAASSAKQVASHATSGLAASRHCEGTIKLSARQRGKWRAEQLKI